LIHLQDECFELIFHGVSLSLEEKAANSRFSLAYLFAPAAGPAIGGERCSKSRP